MTIQSTAKKCIDSNTETIKKLIDYTSQTGNETGTIFYKPNDKCIAKNFCIGDKCSVQLIGEHDPTKKDDRIGDIHVHPSPETPTPSYTDIFSAMKRENPFKCIASTDNEIMCFTVKTDPESIKKLPHIRDAQDIIDKYNFNIKDIAKNEYSDEIDGVSPSRDFDIMVLKKESAHDINRIGEAAEYFNARDTDRGMPSPKLKSIDTIYETKLD